MSKKDIDGLFWVVKSMIVFRWKDFLHRFLIFFVTILFIYFINNIFTNSAFELTYLLLLAVLLTIGDQYPKGRILCFTTVLFFLDISPGFLFLPPVLVKLSSKKFFS